MKTSYLTSGALLATLASSQSSCQSPSGSVKPTVASGFSLQVVATGLSSPRGIAFDDQGHLLVVEAGSGIVSSHTVGEQNGCVTLTDSTTVVDQGLSLNHGLQVNGTVLYASNPNSVYSWAYNSSARTVSSQEELVTGMNNSDHSTRTLLVSEKVPGLMVVTRGSNENLDFGSANVNDGPAQVRAFNFANRTGTYNWTQGLLLGWGNRNEVGISEHPETGGIYGVENSADQIHRMGVDVSMNNPGEELNFFGYLNGTPYKNQGGFFGYPWCLAAWNVTELPDNSNITVGEQFAFDQSSTLDNQNRTDAFCAGTVQPRLVFQAHQAPLDIKFNNSGTEGWVTFHGSWDRSPPVGYKISVIEFQNGEPVEASTSNTAAVDIVGNSDLSSCPDNCFRPVSMAFDQQGRIFFSSDATGEIYLLTRTANEPNGTTPSGIPTISATGTSTATGSASTKEGAGYRHGPSSVLFGAMSLLALLLLH